jgi:hypothetical protein
LHNYFFIKAAGIFIIAIYAMLFSYQNIRVSTLVALTPLDPIPEPFMEIVQNHCYHVVNASDGNSNVPARGQQVRHDYADYDANKPPYN